MINSVGCKRRKQVQPSLIHSDERVVFLASTTNQSSCPETRRNKKQVTTQSRLLGKMVESTFILVPTPHLNILINLNWFLCDLFYFTEEPFTRTAEKNSDYLLLSDIECIFKYFVSKTIKLSGYIFFKSQFCRRHPLRKAPNSWCLEMLHIVWYFRSPVEQLSKCFGVCFFLLQIIEPFQHFCCYYPQGHKHTLC